MSRKISRNIPLLFIIKICSWFMLYMPVIKLFYAENNLDDFDLFLLHAIYSGVIFIVEIPSGYLADVWKRKRSVQSGMLISLAGFAIYSATSGFWGFLFAEMALGIGQGFISGSDTALLYDSLLEEKKEKKYLKTEGYITGSGNIAEALAGIMVTLLAFSTVRYYYYLQTILTFAGLIFSLFLIEPATYGKLSDIGFRSIITVVKETLWHNKTLSRYIIFSSIIGFSSLSMAWFAQIFIYDAAVPHRYFGIIWTVLNGMVALGSFSSHFIGKQLGIRRSLVFILLFLSGGYFIAAQTITLYGIIFLLLFYYARGFAHPILKDRINANTRSDVRATVFSVRSLLIRLMFAALGPLLGYYTKHISLSFALTLAGTVIFVPGIILLILLLKKDHVKSR
jgi:MFS family permease